MRVACLRAWLSQFQDDDKIQYEMDCFHPNVWLKITTKEKGTVTLDISSGKQITLTDVKPSERKEV